MRTLLALPCLLIACATTEPIAAPSPQGSPTRLEAVPRQPAPFDWNEPLKRLMADFDVLVSEKRAKAA